MLHGGPFPSRLLPPEMVHFLVAMNRWRGIRIYGTVVWLLWKNMKGCQIGWWQTGSSLRSSLSIRWTSPVMHHHYLWCTPKLLFLGPHCFTRFWASRASCFDSSLLDWLDSFWSWQLGNMHKHRHGKCPQTSDLLLQKSHAKLRWSLSAWRVISAQTWRHGRIQSNV